jgi:type II secretion system protein H
MKHPSQRHRSREGGFTMLELMIVLAIIGVLVTLALSYMQDMDRERLKTALRDVVSNLQLARMNAFEEGQTWVVQFDTGGNPGYRLLSGAGGDGTWGTADDVEFKTVSLADYAGVSFGSGHGAHAEDPGEADISDGCSMPDNRVFFQTDGTVTTPAGGSAQGMVYMQTQKGDTVAAGVISAAGLIKSWRNFDGTWRDR